MKSNSLVLKNTVAKVLIIILAIIVILSSCTSAKNESNTSSVNTSSIETSSKTVNSKKTDVSSKEKNKTTVVSSKATQSINQTIASSTPTESTTTTTTTTSTTGVDKYDIMIIGASNVYRYFVPAIIYEKYGYTSQVVADASTIGPMFKYLIAEAAVRYNPELFIVDLRWFVKYQKEPPKNPDIIKQNLNAINRIKTKSIRERAAKEVLEVFGFAGNMTTAQLKEKYPEWFTISQDAKLFNSSDLLKGYRPSSRVAKVEKKDYSKFNESTPLYENTEKRLRSLLEFCQSNNYNVMFTLTPYVASETDMRYSNAVNSLLKSYGYTLLDFNKISNDVGLDFNTDFYNTRHTNINGAVKVSSYIGKYISKKYNIKASSNDLIKAEWSKITDYWDKKYEEVIEKLNKKLSK